MDNPTLTLLFLKVTALLLAGAAISVALRRANAGARHLVWVATLAGLLLLPAFRFTPLRWEVLPRVWVGIQEARPLATQIFHSSRGDSATREPAPATVLEAPTPMLHEKPLVPLTVAAVTPASGDERRSWSPGVTLRQGLFAVWIAVALALLGYFAAGVFSVRRIIRSAEPLDAPQWTALLAEAADRLDLNELPRLVASDRASVPFAFGAWRSTIVLPARATEWSHERRRLVLSHELAHVKRRDFLGHALGRVACAVYWCHPLVWVAARRLRAEGERACDDLVLGSGARASDYADHLLDILTSVRHERVPAAALAMARRREFEGRLLAILDPALKRGRLRRMQSVAILAGLAALFVTVAASAPSGATASTPPAGATASTSPSASQESVTAPATLAQREPGLSPVAARHPASTPATTAVTHERSETRADSADAVESEGEEKPIEITADRRATLIRVLKSDSEASVRRTAAWALAESRESDAVEALSAALRGDSSAEVREMAAWALSGTRSESGAAALADALRGDASHDVRATAAWALGQRRRDDVSKLVGAISDASPNVREVAIWALGNQGIDKAPEALVAALRDPEDQVRVVTGWALAQIHDPATVTALQAAFKAEKDDEVRRALFHALFLIGERSPEVLEWAFGSKDAELRGAAVRMMAGRGFGPWPWPWPRPEPRPLP
jgi:beta-lactamase regulating signal transducer with metallopeptidase domain/HEAT repeat protein